MSDSSDHETFEFEIDVPLQEEKALNLHDKEYQEYVRSLSVLGVKDSTTDSNIARAYESHLASINEGDELFNDGQLELNMLMVDR